MPRYEDVIRVFRMDGSKEFTDVWNFPSVRPYKGKHPAEKPSSMLEHIIEATTFPDDIVLDCFAGSGSTAVASIKLGRLAIAMEIETHWVNYVGARVKAERQTTGDNPETIRPEIKDTSQLGLFAGAK
jgi:site-specific DNA-methyltransferase (adenine-specific)